jgi:hypothetical protein
MSQDKLDRSITFCVGESSQEAMRICADGKFFVYGREVTQDREVYEGFVRFLKESGYYQGESHAVDSVG